MIQVFKPKMRTYKIMKGMEEILNKGWIGLGPKTKELEEKISKYIGYNMNVTCLNSGTAALHLAIKALDLKQGDMVATTPISFISTNHVLLYENLFPVFYDVETRTGNVSVDSLARVLRNHPIKAIMVVHVGGYPCDMTEVNHLADLHKIPVIEDCAHAFGALYSPDHRIGASHNICCYSFHAVKNLPMADGGAVLTIDSSIDAYFKEMRWLGIDKDTASRSGKGYAWEYNVEHVGYKYHMNDITAVMGLAQLEYIDEDNARRKEIAEYYMDNIKSGIAPDYEDRSLSSYHFCPMFFEERDDVYQRLVDNDIFPGMHYKRNDKYEMYKVHAKNELEGADWYEKHELTLPIHLGLTDEDVETVVRVINEG